MQTRSCWFQKHTCGTFTQSDSKPMGLGGRETEMEEAGLTAGCAHKPPLPFKPKARPCVRNQHKSNKMKEHGGGGDTTVGGRPPPPEEGEQSPTWKAAQKRNKTEPNKIKTLSLSKPSHLFLFFFFFFLFLLCLASQWHRKPASNGENYCGQLHLHAPNRGWEITMPLLKWRLSPHRD